MALKSTIRFVEPYGNQNYALNPSGEIAGNFSNQGSGTVTRVTTFQKYGLYSYQVVMAGNGDGGNFTLLALSNNPNYVTFRVRAAGVRLNITIGSATREAVFLEKIDSDWRLFGALFTASETSGQANLRITQIGAGANTIYLDGLQVEPAVNARYTTYTDGTQEGCGWLGAPHASASTRSGDSRAGGEVKNFWEGYNFLPEKILGAGAVVEDLNIDNYAFLPGGELNSSKIQPREFSLIGFFLGNTKEELHEKAQALELELGLNTYPGSQPVRLRYSGARVQKEIAARYAGGLEGDLPIYHNDDWSIEDERWVRNYKFKMRASIQFIATDPFWYEIGESSAILSTNETATFRVVAGRLESLGQWSNLGPPGAGGTYTIVYALAEDDTYLYIGGNFLNFDGIADADYIVRYHKQTGVYSAMAPLNGIVTAIAIAPNGDVYIGGEFTNASGVAAADNIARWPVGGSAFVAVGVPVSGSAAITDVFALFFDPAGLLWIGGEFVNWANIANADNIVTWDGSTYAAPSTGANGIVYTFAYGNGLLYVGGAFSVIGGVSVDQVAAWTGSNYIAVGSGLAGQTNALVFWNGLLIAGNQSPPFIAAWNGSIWQTLGGDVNGTVQSLAVGADGTLYLGGTFTAAGGITLADRIARFNGSTFSHLDIDLPGTPSVLAILAKSQDLYIGFNTTGTGSFAGIQTVLQNNGTILAFPRIVFVRAGGASATIQFVRNERTNRELIFNYSLLDGESLTIDLNPRKRTIISSFFGSRMDAVLPVSNFSTWYLLPNRNPVSSFVSISGGPTVVGYLLWREPYRSWS